MATLQAKKIKEALARARGVGQVEDEATIAGCRIVLRSLRPDEYETIHAETQEKDDIAYLNAYRAEHLCRSIVEVDDVDLRGIDSVEVDVEETDEHGKQAVRTVKIETHEYVRDHIIATWSREAVDVAFKKFNDVVEKSDRISSQGVTFNVPDETPEEKYRRLLSELREAEGELPMDLSNRLLEDHGYAKRATQQDFEAAEERLNRINSRPTEPESSPEPEVPPPAPVAAPVARPMPRPSPQPAPSPVVRPAAVAPEQPMSRPATPDDLMRLRTPLNQTVPVHPPAIQPTEQPPLTRSQKIAMEEDFDLSPDPAVQARAIQPGTPDEMPPVPKLDPKAAATIIDQPPPARMNPRFRPPPRM